MGFQDALDKVQQNLPPEEMLGNPTFPLGSQDCQHGQHSALIFSRCLISVAVIVNHLAHDRLAANLLCSFSLLLLEEIEISREKVSQCLISSSVFHQSHV